MTTNIGSSARKLFRLRHGHRTLLFGAGTVTLGRRSTCDYVLTDSQVSREHARIVVGDQTFAIEDLGSANGVTVNGQPISGLKRLNTGDAFQVGSQVFEVLPPTEGELNDDRGEQTVIARRAGTTELPSAPREESWSEHPTGIVSAEPTPGKSRR